MRQYYEIRTSRTQLILLICVHTLIAGSIYFSFEADLFLYASIALIGLFGLQDYRSMIRQDIILLRLPAEQEPIEIQVNGQTYFYLKNKVYQTRWFAILKLIDKRKSRVLILNSDRFDSPESYQQLRFALRTRELSSVA